jgi:hypothetical protein
LFQDNLFLIGTQGHENLRKLLLTDIFGFLKYFNTASSTAPQILLCLLSCIKAILYIEPPLTLPELDPIHKNYIASFFHNNIIPELAEEI